jgi:hypothetical protein
VPLVDWSAGLRDNVWLSLANVGVTLLMLFFVRVGAGSILAWSLREAVAEGTVGRMATTALPLLVLVVTFVLRHRALADRRRAGGCGSS